MIEFVQAHATYRFVIFDEEDERPRLLVSVSYATVSASSLFAKLWMFKPSIRLAYNMRTPRASPKNAAIHAAKVLYKLFGPSEDPIDLNRYALSKSC
jgi:ubiquitin-protein ligase E3 D